MENNQNSKEDKLDNRFIIVERKGQGATADVYLVKDNEGNQYAAKVLKKPSDFFKKEIEMLKLVKSPFITNLVESGKGDLIKNGKNFTGKQYIILDYAEKGELFDYIYLPQKGLGEKLGKFYFYKILEGINSCHNVGVCHRDLKMENILLDNNYYPKISDFGFSTLISGEDGKNYLSTPLGTLSYACPEILSHKKYNGIKADVISLGVVLMTLVTCKIGFLQATRKDPYYRLIMTRQFNKYWKIVSSQIPQISDNLKDLYLKMITFTPENRPTIPEIMDHPWFEEIKNLSKEDKKQLEEECFKDFEAREKIIKENHQNQMEVEENEEESHTGFRGENDFENYFSLNMRPKYYNKTGLNMKYFIKIKGITDPVNFMNKLCNYLKNNYTSLEIEPSKKNLNFICTFTKNENENNEEIDEITRKELEKLDLGEEDIIQIEEQKIKIKLMENFNNEYILKFEKKSGNMEDFYMHLKEIKENIKNI